MIRAGIVGGTGYTGVELMRYSVPASRGGTDVAVTSRTEQGKPVSDVFPSLRGVIDLTVFRDPRNGRVVGL